MRSRSNVSQYTSTWLRSKYPYWNPPTVVPTVLETSSATTVTASGTINTKGSWTQIIASTNGAGDMLRLTVDIDIAGVNTGALLDIGIGGAGAEVAVMSNLAIGSLNAQTFDIPLKIPPNSRIAARTQAAVASRQAVITVAPCFTDGYELAPESVDVLGTSTATSLGTALGSNAWTEITASTTKAYSNLIAVISSNLATATNENAWHGMAYGAAGSEILIYGFLTNHNASEAITYLNGGVPSLQVASAYSALDAKSFSSGIRLAIGTQTHSSTKQGCIIAIPTV